MVKFFDYRLAFEKNMEIIKRLHVPSLKEEVKPFSGAFSVHKDGKTEIVSVTTQDFLAVVEELPYINDDEMEDETPFLFLEDEEDEDLIEARRLNEL